MNEKVTFQKSMLLVDEIDVKRYTQNLFISDALGRVLAEDIVAKSSSPQVPTSGMDGYAIKHSDIDKELSIVDINPAGNGEITPLEKNSTIKTMTGALMPAGADTLVPIENVKTLNGKIKIIDSVPKGYAVREIGENYKCDEVLITRGTTIDFAEIGVLASLNIPQVKVYTKPTVAILSTGSEILDIGEVQRSLAQIRSSNHLTIEAIAKKYGANTNQLGIVSDNYDEIKESILHALESSDIVVTTGGVSVGDFDFVKDIIRKEIGAEIIFKGVKIKPGQHIVLAQKDNKFIIGLPGFAYSSSVTAILYMLPLIRKFQNSDKPIQRVKAKLLTKVENYTSKMVYRACNLEYSNGQYFADLDGKRDGTSAILTNLIGGCNLMMLDVDDEIKDVGDEVEVLIV
jgi:molybdopterin molybdotransferase